MYNINFDLLIKRLLPSRKKDQWHLDWLSSMLQGLKTLHSDFLSYKTESLNQLSYNSQTLIFNKLLNDFCDPIQKRIYIDNSFDNIEIKHLFDIVENETPLYLYDISENKPPLYLHDFTEVETDIDFFVYVPTELTEKEQQIRALVEKYKLSSTNYQIIYF